MAGSPDPALDPLLGWLPSESEDGRSPQVDGLPAHGACDRLCAWSTPDGVHVRGAGRALRGLALAERGRSRPEEGAGLVRGAIDIQCDLHLRSTSRLGCWGRSGGFLRA